MCFCRCSSTIIISSTWLRSPEREWFVLLMLWKKPAETWPAWCWPSVSWSYNITPACTQRRSNLNSDRDYFYRGHPTYMEIWDNLSEYILSQCIQIYSVISSHSEASVKAQVIAGYERPLKSITMTLFKHLPKKMVWGFLWKCFHIEIASKLHK